MSGISFSDCDSLQAEIDRTRSYLDMLESRLADFGKVPNPDKNTTITDKPDQSDEAQADEAQEADIARALARAVDRMRDGVALFDSDGQLRFASKRISALLPEGKPDVRPGLSLQELLDCPGVFPVDFPPDQDVSSGRPGQPDEDGLAAECVCALTLPDGGNVQVTCHPLPSGETVAVFHRVTRADRARTDAEKAAERLRDAVQSLGEGFILYDADDRLLLTNNLIREGEGRASADVARASAQGALFRDQVSELARDGAYLGFILPEEEASGLAEERSRNLEGLSVAEIVERRMALHMAVPCEFLMHMSSGRWIRVNEQRTSENGRVIIWRDITRQRQRESHYQATGHLLQTIFDSIDQGVAIFDASFCLHAWNRNYCRLLDFPDSLIHPGISMREIVDFQAKRGIYGPGDPEKLAEQRYREIAGDGPRRVEEAVRRGNITLDVRRYPMPDGGFVGIFTDITRLAQREQELAEKSALLQTALESMDQGLCVFDQNARLLAWNDSFLNLNNYPAHYAKVGQRAEEFLHFQIARGEITADLARDVLQTRRDMTGGSPAEAGEMRRRDGRILELRTRPFPGGGWVSTFTDMTERRKTEREVQENWQLLSAIVETVPCALGVKDAGGKFLYANEEIGKQFGWEPDELIGRTAAEVLGEEADGMALMEDYVVRTGLPLADKEIEISAPDSAASCSYVMKLNPIFDEGGGVKAVVTAALDISHHKRIERELVDQSRLLHAMLNSIDQGFVGFDEDFTLFAWNDRWREISDCPDNLLHIGMEGRVFLDYFDNQKSIAVAGCSSLQEIGSHGESGDARQTSEISVGEFCLADLPWNQAEITTGQGDVFEVRRFPVIGKGYVATFTDITERKRREQEIENHRRLLRTTFDAMRDGLACFDARHRLILWNSRFFDLMDYPADMARTGTPYQLFLTADIEAGRPADARTDNDMATARLDWLRRNIPLDFEWQRADSRVLRYRSYPIPGGGFVISTTDITRGKQQEQLLRQSEARLSFLSENADEGVIVHDGRRIVDVNSATLRITGRAIQDLRQADLDSIVVPGDRERLARMMMAERDERQEFEGLRADGQSFPMELQSKARSPDYDQLYPAAGAGAALSRGDGQKDEYDSTRLILVRDITERRQVEEERARLEAQLRQSQKLEAIGTLAGGIAHDFNNVLGSILGYTEMAVGDDDTGERPRRYMGEVLKAANRAKDLVNRILSFSRRGESSRTTLDLREAVGEAVQLLRPSLPSTIRIDCLSGVEVEPVFADPTELHQIIVNLVNNAAQAMPEGGVLTLAIDRVQLADSLDPPTGEYGSQDQEKVRLRISDTGVGMEAPVIERIFDPFFTTKEVGAGTGLGLAVVHRLVTSHGGSVTVSSEIGKGSHFEILLPLHPGQTITAQPQPEEANRCGAGEHVLVVDDEPQLVDVCREMLGDLGYRVTGCSDSLAALATFRASPEQFHLVLTDQTMPNMTGMQLAEELRKIRQDIPVLLMTGYSRMAIAGQARAAGIHAILRKPFNFRDIARETERALKNPVESG